MKVYLAIFQVCLLILFTELLLIRWISTEMNIFAYLQNSVLVACFLGLGVGLIEPKPTDYPPRLLVPLGTLCLVLMVPQIRVFARDSSTILGGFHDFTVWDHLGKQSLPLIVAALGVVALILGCCWAIMVQLGAQLASLLQEAPGRMQAYSADMLGSLAGVWLFTALAFLCLSPWAWFLTLVVLLLAQPSFRKPIPLLGCLAILGLAAWNGALEAPLRTTWTPYQKLQFRPLKDGEWDVAVNNVGFQQIQNNSAQSRQPREQREVTQYNLPSRLAGNPAQTLIVGAGTGNDVAGALANSQARIIAVDIDPVLLRFGQALHPEKPFDDPRVEVRVNDARATFQSLAPASFDLIVFGLLDSHTTPNLSNARLDNFVYTLESITAASRLLKPNGVMVVLFQTQREYIGSRLFNTLLKVFNTRPVVFRVPHSEQGWGGVAFVVGAQTTLTQSLEADPGLARFIEANLITAVDPKILPTRDSWPYLYIEQPSIPSLFWVLGGVFATLWALSSKFRYGRVLGPDLRRPEELYMVLLGASFSLVQVFSICKASILFGSTWLVNSAAISGILAMILVANALVPVVKLPRAVVTAVLGLSCFGLAVLPLSRLLVLAPSGRFVAAALLSGLPMVCSGILFGRAFVASRTPGRALGANLFGAMLGSALQLLSFRLGIPSLMMLAGAFYLASAAVPVEAADSP